MRLWLRSEPALPARSPDPRPPGLRPSSLPLNAAGCPVPPARPAAAQPYPARFAVGGRAGGAPPLGRTIETQAPARAARSSESLRTPGCRLLSERLLALAGGSGWCREVYQPPKPGREVEDVPSVSWLSGRRVTHLGACTQVTVTAGKPGRRSHLTWCRMRSGSGSQRDRSF